MIWVTSNVDGEEYKEPFSKGIMSRSLNISYIGSKRAYELASEIEEELIKKDMSVISRDELADIVLNHLITVDPKIAEKYKSLRLLRNSKKPLIILIGGSSGVGTSSMAFELANRLRLKNIISTDMIREVMRKIVSKDLSPVIHKSSYDAYESIRTPSLKMDKIVEGFITHADVVNVGIEAIIERSIKEGISIIIEGVHVVPGFISKDLMENNNIIMFTLMIDDEELHKQRFYLRCSQPWVKRSLENYMENFESIRKTQDFFVEQAKIYDSHIINNIEINETINQMVSAILEKFVGVNDVR
ncbi:MAG: 2-phosphoglycerate kinase [archaeon]|uniref:2-phosphoglycerate kinase n=1 Tax=Methanobrevibacter gottschalkii DSM 11977 TaxID=1122229 RepID=A0A3N5B1Z2_9EURY|nr:MULTISPECIES: 2-phosphoglycerate kinase [Methanobrevibacter]MCQ2970699.1 2-phosphoglycerate kinase [archaeon]OEC97089.1 2-phosphoglycerate kinase [Methanobrevibacter sp. A27]RPF51596.1 2-phosphoglycerate kinase [Methanobrevibacter gottschalkii DSM 11977]